MALYLWRPVGRPLKCLSFAVSSGVSRWLQQHRYSCSIRSSFAHGLRWDDGRLSTIPIQKISGSCTTLSWSTVSWPPFFQFLCYSSLQLLLGTGNRKWVGSLGWPSYFASAFSWVRCIYTASTPEGLVSGSPIS